MHLQILFISLPYIERLSQYPLTYYNVLGSFKEYIYEFDHIYFDNEVFLCTVIIIYSFRSAWASSFKLDKEYSTLFPLKGFCTLKTSYQLAQLFIIESLCYSILTLVWIYRTLLILSNKFLKLYLMPSSCLPFSLSNIP